MSGPFVERYSPWTGRGWLETGAGVIPMKPGYAVERAAAKVGAPGRPWTSDWADGTFEPAPLGLPHYPVVAAGLVATLGAIAGASVMAGVSGATVVGVGATWPLLRLLDHASITEGGLRLGPPWAPRVAWSDVERVGLHVADGRATAWAVTRFGGGSVDVPHILAPAARARLRRLSGLPVEVGDGGLDLRYARWRPAAAGLPLGVLVGTMAATPFTAEPFGVLFVGGLVVVALGALEAAVTARATGWGTGAIAWSTVAYAVVLAAVGIGQNL